jgi:hypothetical protein
MKEFPKTVRTPTSSLYRQVAELRKAHFLHVLGERRFERGALRWDVETYGLTYKGTLAAAIYGYVLYHEPAVPISHRERYQESVERVESSPIWSSLVNWLRWHKEREIDLSRAKVDLAYFNLTNLLVMMEHPSQVKDPSARKLVRKSKQVSNMFEEKLRTALVRKSES